MFEYPEVVACASYRTSCKRAAATICPVPLLPVGAEAPRAAEQTATLQQFLTANTFPRPPLQLPDAPTRR